MTINNKTFLTQSKVQMFLFIVLFWSLSVAQPLMSMFGKEPTFLLAHEVTGWDLVLYTLALNLLIPGLVFIINFAFGLVSKNLMEGIHRVILTFLAFLFCLSLLSQLNATLSISISLILSLFIVFLLVKIDTLKLFCSWFGVASLIAMVNFLVFSQANQLLPKSLNNTSNTNNATGPVVVVVLDEFPLVSLLKDKNTIDESRFPTFAKMADEMTWYPNATSVSSATELAIPALLSGLKPDFNNPKVGSYEQYPKNLFTLFANSHKINAVENSTRMCPSYLCMSKLEDPLQLLIEDSYVSYLYVITPSDLKAKLPPINDRWIGYLRDVKNENRQTYSYSERLQTFQNFNSSIKDQPDETIHFLHVLLPHAPWRILPDLSLYAFYENDGVAGELDKRTHNTQFNHQWTNDDWATKLSWRRHLLQVGAMDALMAELLQQLKDNNIYDESTIVVVSDHGSSFKPGLSRRFAHSENFADIAKIPLFIKFPYQKEGVTDLRFASNLDIIPTLVDHFKMSDPSEFDGVSLISDEKREAPELFFQEGNIEQQLPENLNDMFRKDMQVKNQYFPEQGWGGVFIPADMRDVYGRNIGSLNVREVIHSAIDLKNANLFKFLSNTSRYKPAYYRLESLIGENEYERILVMLNDKVISQCRFFLHQPSDCAGLIDPKEFEANNTNEADQFELRFFGLMRNEGGEVYDELLTKSNRTAILVDGKHVEYESGQMRPVSENKTLYGSVILRLAENGSTFYIEGWSGNTLTGEVADQVHVFINDKLYSSVSTGLPRNHIAQKFGYKSLYDSGYQVTVPRDQWPNINEQRIRVFATVDDGEFNELNYQTSDETYKSAFDIKTNSSIPVNPIAILQNKDTSAESANAFDSHFSEISVGDWYTVHNNYRWVGKSASVLLQIPEQKNEINILLDAKPFIRKGAVDQQIVRILLNGKQINEFQFTEVKSIEFSHTLRPDQKGKKVIITFDMPNATSPFSLGESRDLRELSLLVTKMLIN
jgi:hypothetical protein